MRDGKPVRVMYGDPSKDIYGFPDIELCPLYPAGIFGLKDKGTADFDVMMNQIMIHHDGGSMQWNMVPVYLVRMGLAEDLKKCQRERLDSYQAFYNGFCAEEGMDGGRHPHAGPEWNNVRNVDTDLYTKVKANMYTHFDFETGPILAQSINESLLQSHEGLLRLCPAICKEDDVSFTLYGEGGFKVSAEVSAETYLVTVESLRGEALYIRLPEYSDETKLNAYVVKNGLISPVEIKKAFVGREEVLTFDIAKGDVLLLASDALENIEYEPQIVAEPNNDMKECGKAMLGSPTLLK